MILEQFFFLQFSGFAGTGANLTSCSLVFCSSLCLKTEGCSSFFFNKEVQLCQLPGVRYQSTTGLTSAPGYRYYMAPADCSQGWVAVSGHCYWYREDRKAFSDAKASCETLGGYLSITSTVEENAIIASVLAEHGGSTWLGGSDEAVEGQWVWVDGQPFTLDLWYPPPFFKNSTMYNCLEHQMEGWMDGLCSWCLPYLCEK